MCNYRVKNGNYSDHLFLEQRKLFKSVILTYQLSFLDTYDSKEIKYSADLNIIIPAHDKINADFVRNKI